MSSVQEEALELFKKKNKDYGDAFASYGSIGVLVRMGDKISRLVNIDTPKILVFIPFIFDANIISSPPEIWIVVKIGLILSRASRPFLTVFGISCNFKSKKILGETE